MKSLKVRFLIVFVLSMLALASKSAGQDSKDQKPVTVTLSDSTLVPRHYGIVFNDLKKQYYEDPSKLNRIKQLDKPETQKEMYQALKIYVQNFGVENFSKNAPILWKLAKLSEQFGPPGEAIQLYRLVLKHHQQGIDINQLYKRYDEVETEKKENYVDLDYYYQLVDYRKEIDTLRPPHSVLINMGQDINSLKEDYGPTMGNVDFVLLFTSKRNMHKDKRKGFNEDLFYALKIDGVWAKTESFKNINTDYNEGSACLSKDGKYLYFSRCDAPGSYGNCDLYVAHLGKDSTWTNIRNLGPHVNSSSWDSQPSLSHRGDTLFFASTRSGGYGVSDIYYSVKSSNGKWGKAKNAGPGINTVKSELSPFFHHQYNVLYFSSNGQPLNFGGFDIYKTYASNRSWGEPKNIGPLVNGAGDEYYFTIDSQSLDLYYARSNEDDKKNLDLYSFPVPMEAQPLATIHLKGSLIDQNGKPLGGIVSVIDLDHSVEVAPQYVQKDGSFGFDLINKRRYLLVIQGDDYFRIEEVFFLDGDKTITKVGEPLDAKIAFRSVEFENGKAEILPSMHDDLGKVGNFLIDHPQLKLKISGHTDSAGNENLNLKLSQDRADAIKGYLIQQFKFVEARVIAIGFGSSDPIVSKEETEEHKQLNRRVEFQIIKE